MIPDNPTHKNQPTPPRPQEGPQPVPATPIDAQAPPPTATATMNPFPLTRQPTGVTPPRHPDFHKNLLERTPPASAATAIGLTPPTQTASNER